MTKNTILAAALLLFSPVAGLAADLSSQPAEPPAPTASPFTWTGFYVGGYAGGAFATNKLKSFGGSTSVSLSPDGFTGGGLVGFNYQIGSVVFGGEGEFGYDGWEAGKNYLNARGGTRHAESEGSYIGRVRGRVGYALDNLLLYTAGGVSFADDKVTQTNNFVGVSNSITKDFVGWNVGAGAEYAFTPNWIGRLEYIYDGFGKKTYDFQSLPGTFANRRVGLDQNTIRVALSYKF
ncbi:outer membrane protein [Rhizobium sp. ZPR3]|uniref:Outer membrane protein n=2 Tax=unclassified Rhizobium TaxID=2613769 RepID=A0AAU7SQ17_9HYPH